MELNLLFLINFKYDFVQEELQSLTPNYIAKSNKARDEFYKSYH